MKPDLEKYLNIIPFCWFIDFDALNFSLVTFLGVCFSFSDLIMMSVLRTRRQLLHRPAHKLTEITDWRLKLNQSCWTLLEAEQAQS